MFVGFDRLRVRVSCGELNVVKGGAGPPLLLLHGYPQTHVMWHLIAPELARTYTVVAADLRGYGDSPKPADDVGHTVYSKREMARDQCELMTALGFDRYAVVGHDRGGRVGHRMALDAPDRVSALAVLDIVPTIHRFDHIDQAIATKAYHWFFLIQPGGLPERLIGANPAFFLRHTMNSWAMTPDFATPEAFSEYLRCFSNLATIAATCADYRAAATTDLLQDRNDVSRRLDCPMLVLWGEASPQGSSYAAVKTWERYALRVSGAPVTSGHFLAEEAPADTLKHLTGFLSSSV